VPCTAVKGEIFYWQDKSHREIDFIIRRGRDRVDVVECKINPDKLNVAPVQTFREITWIDSNKRSTMFLW
jgi:predicted AAA+ superfamily ATPase